MARKTKEEAQQTRERILDAAEEIFTRRGVCNATIAHIAAQAHISRGAIYGHYKNKVDVCLAMCKRAVERAAIPQQYLTEPSALSSLLQMGMFCLQQWLTPGSMEKTLRILYFLCEDHTDHIPLKRFLKGWELAYYRRLRLTLRRAMRQGELPSNLNICLAQTFINCAMTGIYHSKANENTRILTSWEDVQSMLLLVADSLCHSEHLRHSAPDNIKSVPTIS